MNKQQFINLAHLGVHAVANVFQSEVIYAAEHCIPERDADRVKPIFKVPLETILKPRYFKDCLVGSDGSFTLQASWGLNRGSVRFIPK